MKMKLSEIAKAINGTLNINDKDKVITKVVTDSRGAIDENVCAKGVLFAAISGERVDGHIFASEIIGAGGAAIVDESEYAVEGTILVEDVKTSLGVLARYYRNTYLNEKQVVFITGSAGKTTTKEMTASAFGKKKIYKTQGNRNSLIGLPLSILECPADAEVLVLEAGMNNKGEILQLSKIASPDIVIITNIGKAHIENLGSIENILEEKLSAVSGLRKGGALILNMDDEKLSECKDRYENIFFYSTVNSDADYIAYNLAYCDKKSVFELECSKTGYRAYVEIPAIGEHNVLNALAAFAAADLSNVEKSDAIEGLSTFVSAGNRQRIYEKGGIVVIADCYNASPESVKAALTVLSLSKGRKIAVLGDMLELGELSEQLHKETGQNAARYDVDLLIAIGDYASFTAEAFGGEHIIFNINERDKAIEYISNILKDGDTILFKASNRLDFSGIISSIPVIN